MPAGAAALNSCHDAMPEGAAAPSGTSPAKSGGAWWGRAALHPRGSSAPPGQDRKRASPSTGGAPPARPRASLCPWLLTAAPPGPKQPDPHAAKASASVALTPATRLPVTCRLIRQPRRLVRQVPPSLPAALSPIAAQCLVTTARNVPRSSTTHLRLTSRLGLLHRRLDGRQPFRRPRQQIGKCQIAIANQYLRGRKALAAHHLIDSRSRY